MERLLVMLKGINRRIIEINRTNNDYFEKAILFVRSDKLNFEQQLLSREANAYLKKLAMPPKSKRNLQKKIMTITTIAFLLCIVVFGIFSVII